MGKATKRWSRHLACHNGNVGGGVNEYRGGFTLRKVVWLADMLMTGCELGQACEWPHL